MIDPIAIRKDFPQYVDQNFGAYLDSSATSLTPRVVIEAMTEYYSHFRANVHRGTFKESMTASRKYDDVRVRLAGLLGVSPDQIIFTNGATDASNRLVRMLEHSEDIKWGDKIVSTVMEHHASLVPLQQLVKRTGATLELVPIKDGMLDLEVAVSMITSDVRIVSAVLASNVTGELNDVRKLADLAHLHAAIMVVDATAAMGHIPVLFSRLGADAMYFSAHKMFGPTGVGALVLSQRLVDSLQPAVWGGGMIAHVSEKDATWAPAPEKFEPGTPNISGVIGWGAGLEYLEQFDLSEIHDYLGKLTVDATQLLESIPGVRVVSQHDEKRNIGIVTFVVDGIHTHDIAEILSRDRVAVRPGHHCAEPLHHALGVVGTTRASFHIYNTHSDIEQLCESLKKAIAVFSPK